MDYLAQNVIGRIPRFEELSEAAQVLSSLQGVRSAAPEEKPAVKP